MDYYKDKVFPVVRDRHAGDSEVLAAGLSKREYFAGLALQAFIVKEEDNFYSPDTVAQFAVAYANALISELEAPAPDPAKR